MNIADRIHADINQIRSDNGGTVTGRFSYSNPNLQQIPARNKDLGPIDSIPLRSRIRLRVGML